MTLLVDRAWHLYRIWGRLPREAGLLRWLVWWLLGQRQVLLYIGITGRDIPFRRPLEHATEKPWARDMALCELDHRSYQTELGALKAETAAIRRERPVWNVAHNGTNPRAVTRTRRRHGRHVVRRRGRYATVAGLWLMAAGAGWWTLAEFGVEWAPGGGAAGATLLLMAGGRPRRRRR